MNLFDFLNKKKIYNERIYDQQVSLAINCQVFVVGGVGVVVAVVVDDDEDVDMTMVRRLPPSFQSPPELDE